MKRAIRDIVLIVLLGSLSAWLWLFVDPSQLRKPQVRNQVQSSADTTTGDITATNVYIANDGEDFTDGEIAELKELLRMRRGVRIQSGKILDIIEE